MTRSIPRLLGIHKIKVGAHYEGRAVDLASDQLPDAVRSGIWQFWVLPASSLPELSRSGEPEADALRALNGLILLQHGMTTEGKREASRIAIVDRIQHTGTGHVVRHEAQLRTFEALEKCIRQWLCFSSILKFADGHE